MVFSLFANDGYGAHLKGADIEYKCISGSQYEVTLYYYWDCTPPGLGVATTARANNNFDFTNSCGLTNPNPSFKLINPGGTEITQICPSAVSSCTNTVTFDVDGALMLIFKDTVTLASNCVWNMRYDECCRDNKTNISGSPNFSVDAQLRTTVSACNTSPAFTSQPAPYICQNSPYIMSLGAFDADGDSLVFELAKAETSASGTVTYNAGYDFENPIDTLTPYAPNLNINPFNGDIAVFPVSTGDFTVVVKIKEYDRNTKFLKGYIKRDFALFVVSCASNSTPNVKANGAKNINSFGSIEDSTTINTLPINGTLCFDLEFEDLDASDTLSITSNISAILGASATLTQTGINPVTAKICWPLNGVAAGTYTINVVGSDDNCPVNASVSVNIDIKVGSDVTISSNPGLAFTAILETCNGSGDGSLQANFNGGVGPFKYEWYDGLTLQVDTTQVLSNPAVGGFYSFKVIDKFNNNNSLRSPVHNYQATPPIFVSGETSSPASCNGVCDGSILIGTVSGGTTSSSGITAFSYNWDNTTDTTNNPTGLCAGNYALTITDDNNCPIIRSFSINSPPVFTAFISDSIDVLCRGMSTGELKVDADVANCGAVSAFCATPDLDTIGTGTSTNGLFDYPSPYGLVFLNTRQQYLYTASELTSFGLAEGKISGVDFFVTQSFSTPSTLSNFSIKMGCSSKDTLDTWETSLNVVLDPQNYSLSQFFSSSWLSHNLDRSFVWDGSSNIVVEVAYSVPSSLLNAQVSYTTTTFNSSAIYYNSDTSDASVSTLITGRSKNRPNVRFSNCPNIYTYKWSHDGVLNDSVASGLPSGNYSVILTNENGCKDTVAAGIQQPDSTFKFVFTDSTSLICNDDTNGSVTLTPKNGLAPYRFQWPSGVIVSSTSDSISVNLRGDSIYAITVLDTNQCTQTRTFSLKNPPELDPTFTIVKNIICSGDSSGRVKINTLTGVAPFHYQWSPNVDYLGTDSSTAINIVAGIRYTITVTDDENCSDTVGFELNLPDGIIPTVTSSADVNCFGDTDGIATITPTNGSAIFNYQWIPAANANTTGAASTATDLVPNINYKVIVIDGNSCKDSILNVSINQPTLLQANFVDSADALCFGAANGTARIVPTGGTKTYSYSWSHDGTVTDSIATNLPKGRHVVTITDSKTCEVQDSVNIGEPAANMVANINIIEDVTCKGFSDGFLSVKVTGGKRNYNYTWTTVPAQTDSFASNLIAGEYIVNIIDNQTCTATDTMIITEPDSLIATITDVQTLDCFGDNNASISVTPSGGTKPYAYQWNTTPPQTDSTAIGLIGSVAGISYKVVLIDSNNQCSDSATQIITQPTDIVITRTDSNGVECFGSNEGSARIIASGGTPGYSFLWNTVPVQTDSNATNLIAGTYKVVVIDQGTCKDSTTFIIDQPTAVITGNFFDLDSTTCNGANNGSATYSARGGTEPYKYTWSGGTGTINDSITTGLGPGQVTISVTDNNNCPAKLDTAQLTEPDPISASFVKKIDAGCKGGNAGSITARVTSGDAPFIFRWSNGTGGLNDSTVTSLLAGAISVTIKSVADTTCVITINEIITDNPAIGLVVDSVKNISCNGLSDGFIAVHGIGGDGTYIYSWTPNNAVTDSFASGLSAATNYTISITNAAGCAPADTALTLSQPNAIVLTKVDSLNVSCFGNSDGKARISVSGGTPNYSFSWSTTPIQTNDSATGLALGVYEVIVTDVNSCTDSLEFNIEQPGQAIFVTSKIDSTLKCFGDNDAVIRVSPKGGTLPYSYNWSHNITLNDSVATGLGTGTYIVEISDSNDCKGGLDTIVVDEPNDITATIIVDSNVTCFGLSDGGMSISGVSGGTAPYRYLWSGGAAPLNDSIITGLAAGGYAVTITDTNNCSVSITDTIVEPTKLVTSLFSPPTIPGFSYIGERNDQYIYFSATSLPWEQARQACLNVGGDLLVIKDTADNNYFSTIFPSSSWIGLYQDTASPLYSEPSGGWFWVDGTSLTFSNWDTGGPNNAFGPANPENHGQFFVSGFWNDIPGTMSNQFGMVINKDNFDLKDASCNGLNDGFASFDAGGGVAPYFYKWSNGDLDSLAENLNVGSYFVTITDKNGCELLDTAIVTEPAELIATIADSTDESCVGLNDGSAIVAWTGGNGNVNYLWSNNTTDSIADSLTSTTYGVRVKDFKGCKDSIQVTIDAANAINLAVTKLSDINCFGENNGSVKGLASGGSGTLSYAWNGGMVSNDTLVTDLPLGFIKVSVSDTNNCIKQDSIEIFQPSDITVSFTIDTIPLCLDSNGQITVNVDGGTQFSSLPYRYYWLDDLLDTLNPQPSDSIASNLKPLAYTLVVEDSNSCPQTKLLLLNSLDGPVITADSVVDATCKNGNDGRIKITVTGAGPFNYLWLPDSTVIEDLTGLDSGSYTVQVKDTNDCPAFETYAVSDGNQFLTSMLSSQVLCNGDSTGNALLLTLGTIGPYSYVWNRGDTGVLPLPPALPLVQIDSGRINLPPGFVKVIVTDGRGCSQADSVFIVEPPKIQSTMVLKNDLNCYGDSTATVTSRVTGGTQPYFMSWTTIPFLPPVPTPVKYDSTKSSLPTGLYLVQISDTTQCSINDTILVSHPDSLALVETGFSNIGCANGNDGMYSVELSGGTKPYSYTWSGGNGSVSDSVSNLIDTTFIQVIVNDSNNCGPKTLSKVLTEPDLIQLVLEMDSVSCFGDSNGIVTAHVTGGNGNYIYTWSNGVATFADSIADSLAIGQVILSVTDTNGCVAVIDSIDVLQPELFTANIIVIDSIDCFADSLASAKVQFSGGNGVVSYSWSSAPSINDSLAIGLYAGTFIATLTDNKSCEVKDTLILDQPSLLQARLDSLVNPSCAGDSNGQVLVKTIGGTKPYRYDWGTIILTDSLKSDVPDGGFTVILRDDNGCFVELDSSLVEPLVLTPNYFVANQPTCLKDTGIIIALYSGGTRFGGTLGYRYTWMDSNKDTLNPSINDSIITGLGTGKYYLAIEDLNGCIDTSFQTLNASDGPVVDTDSVKNPTCVGFTNGAIFISISNGTAPITYSWSTTGDTTKNLLNVGQGTFTLTATDSVGCQGFEVRTLLDPAPISIQFIDTINESCIGNDGSVRAKVSGGRQPYTYSWNTFPPQTDTIVTGLTAGFVVLTVNDSAGICVHVDSVLIKSTSTLSAAFVDSVDVSCFGDANGSAAVQVTGGVKPYNYVWSDGTGGTADSASTGLIAGTVSVAITDQQIGCAPLIISQVIGSPSKLSFIIDTISASCGNSDGQLIALGSGGTVPYSYQWLDNAKLAIGQTNDTASNLLAGLYYLAAADTMGCLDTSNQAINSIGGPSLSSIVNNTTLIGSCDGAINLNITTVGSGIDSILWSSGDTNQNISNKCAGAFSVTVIDSAGCSTSLTDTIYGPPPGPAVILVSSFDSTNCDTSICSGRAFTLAIGGTGPLTYKWSSDPINDTLFEVSNLCANTYYVTVTDSIGVSAIDTVIIPIPGFIQSLGANISDVVCFGDSTGKIGLNIIGGATPYVYSWSSNSNSTVDSAVGLASGTYYVTVTENGGCSANDSIVVNQNNALVTAFASVEATCGQADGQIYATVSGGISDYTLTWLNALKDSLTPAQIGDSAFNLSANFYHLAVSDSLGCVDTFLTSISNIGAPNIVWDTTINASTNGVCDGLIQVTISSATSAIDSILWLPTGDTTEDVSGLCAGIYKLQVTDTSGCKSFFTDTITEPAPIPSLNVLLMAFGASCDSVTCNGKIVASVANATGPLTYLWSNSSNNNDSITNLCFNKYIVTITDTTAGISAIDSIVVGVTPSIDSVLLEGINLSCNNSSNGQVVAHGKGGVKPYAYAWSHDTVLQDSIATTLSAGTYTVTITSSSGCYANDSIVITEPNAIAVSFDTTNANCGVSDGQIVATISGGTPKVNQAYTLVWLDNNGNALSPLQTNDSLKNVTAGFYKLAIADSTCSDTVSVLLGNRGGPTASPNTKAQPSCSGKSDGAIAVLIAGGKLPYKYQWTINGVLADTTLNILGKPSGNYLLQITDSLGCLGFYNDTLINPAPIVLSTNIISQVSCNSLCDGVATASAANLQGVPTYVWSNGEIGPNTTKLCSGTNTVSVTDGNTCTSIDTFNIIEPSKLAIDSVKTVEPNCNQANGSIQVFVSGGNGSYNYKWNGTTGGSILPNISAASYTLEIEDSISSNCSLNKNIPLSNINAPSFDIAASGVSCFNNCDGEVLITNISGKAPISIFWPQFNSIKDTVKNVCANNYAVQVTDSIQCVAVDTITVTTPIQINASPTILSLPDCGQSNGKVIVQNTAGGAPGNTGYTYSWLDDAKIPMAPANNTDSLVGVPSGQYYFRIVDSTLCSADISVNLPNQGAPSIQFLSKTDASCAGVNNGSITINVIGGTQPYNILWLPDSQSTASISNLGAGTYSLQVSDSNNCNVGDSYNIIELKKLSITPTVLQNMSCNNVFDGNATVQLTNATLPLFHSWSNGESSDTAISLKNGINTIVVSDSNGCSVDTSVFITSPSAIILDSTLVTKPNCNANNGVIFVNVSGGSGSYSYKWSNGGNVSGISNLFSGTYTLTVTDGNTCSEVFTIPLSDINAPILATAKTDILCFGACNGSASVSVLSGSNPFTYNWTTLLSANDSIANLCKGVYPIEVTDSVGCKAVDTVSIVEPSEIKVTFSKVLPTCNDSNGSITAIVNGGEPFNFGYLYMWLDANNFPNNPPSSTSVLSGVESNNYNLFLVDSNSCIGNFSVNLPNNITPNVMVNNIIDASCTGICDGEINLTSSGATPFNFIWTQTGDTTEDIDGLCAGNYDLQTTDTTGCIGYESFKVDEISNLKSTTSIIFGVTCHNSCNASATIDVTGATGLLTYLWDNGEQTKIAVALCEGNHLVTVTDGGGCNITDTVIIQNAAPIVIANVNTVEPACNQNNGSIALTVNGGAGSISYLWSTGDQTSTINNLVAGTYNVTILDGNGCFITSLISLSNNAGPVLFTSMSNSQCYGQCDGTAILDSIIGAGPFQVKWPSNGSSALNVSGLCDGVYGVEVTDSLGCVIVDTFNIKESSEINATFKLKLATCALNDGEIEANVVGGTPKASGYTYFWLDTALNPIVPFQNTAKATGLSGGIYNLRITDSLGCKKIEQTAISEIGGPVILLEGLTHASCLGVCDGQILTRVTPTATTTILWYPTGLTADDISNICAGNHRIQATDNAGCVSYADYDIFGVKSFTTFVSSKKDASCLNVNDGEIELTLVGGNLPFTFGWIGPDNFNSNIEDLNNILSGSYTATIQDAKGCTDTISEKVNTKFELIVEAGSDTVICSGIDSIYLESKINLLSNYSLIWIDDFGNTISNQLKPQISPRVGEVNYIVTANSNGCISIDTVKVSTTLFGPVDAGADRTILNGESTIVGGDPSGPIDVDYSWEPFDLVDNEISPNPNTNIDETTTLILTISGSEGCVALDSVTVTVDPNVDIDEGFTPNGDGTNDTWKVKVTEDFPGAEVEVYTRWGQLVYKSPIPYIEWDGTLNGEPLPVGTYYYVVILNDAANSKPITGPLTIVK